MTLDPPHRSPHKDTGAGLTSLFLCSRLIAILITIFLTKSHDLSADGTTKYSGVSHNREFLHSLAVLGQVLDAAEFCPTRTRSRLVSHLRFERSCFGAAPDTG